MKKKLLLAGPSQTKIYFAFWQIRLALAFLYIVCFTSQGWAQTKIWDKTLGGGRNDNLTTIIATSDGGYLLGGTSISGKSGDKTDFNRNGKAIEEWRRQDYWVVKINNRGQKVWDKTFGGRGSDKLKKIIATSDGFLLGGTSNSNIGGDKTESSRGQEDYWVVKIDASGNKLWDKTFGGNKSDEFESLLVAKDGSYILAGGSNSDISGDKSEAPMGEPESGPSDYWVIKFKEDGTKIWDKTLKVGGLNYLDDIIRTTDNHYILGGYVDGYYSILKINDSGNKIWAKVYLTETPFIEVGGDSFQSLTATPDGGFLLGGSSESGAGGAKTDSLRGAEDYWVLKADASGNKLWDKTYGGVNNDYLVDVTLTEDGGFLLGGYSNSDAGFEKSEGRLGTLNPSTPYSGFDYWVIKINASGTKLWDKVYGGTKEDRLGALVKSPGGYVLAGTSNSNIGVSKSENSRGGEDYWAINIKELSRLGQLITFNLISTKRTSDAPFAVTARSTSKLPVTISIVSGPATIKDNIITLTGSGVVTVKASQSGNRAYLAAPDVVQKFLVTNIVKQWEVRLGGPNYDRLTAMISTPDGGYLLGGVSLSDKGGDKSENNKSNDYDYWVVKTDKAGKKIWDRTFGGTNLDYLQDVIATPDGGYLLGGYSASGISGDKTGANRGPSNTYDYWVLKINAAGQKVWDKTYGGKGDDPEFGGDLLVKMVTTPDGGFLLGGSSFTGIGAEKSQSKGGEDYWIIKIDANGVKLWDKAYGGSSIDFEEFTGDDTLHDMISTPDGNFLLAGSSWSNQSSDKSEPTRGYNDYWIIKIDQQGKRLWDKTFGGDSHESVSKVIATSDGGYLLGGSSSSSKSGDKSEEYGSKSNSDYWVVKTDATGKKLWDKTIGGSDEDNLHALVETSDGGYLIGGTSNSNVGLDKNESSRGLNDFWLVKVNSNGSKVDEKTYGGESYEDLVAILPVTDGKYLVGGSTRSKIGKDVTQANRGVGDDYWILQIEDKVAPGQVNWDTGYGGTDRERLTTLLPTADGGYVLGGFSLSGKNGTKTQNSYGANDFWLVKTKANGQKVWDKRFGGSANDYLNAILPTPDGGYLLGGSSDSGQDGDKSQTSRGGRDYWVVKVNSQGIKQWDKRYGGTGFEDIRSMALLPNGDYLLGGYSDSPVGGDKSQASQGQKDYWLVRIKPNGTKVWDKRYGGTNDEELEAVVVTPKGKILLGGSSNSGVSGDVSQSTRGSWDYWLLEIDNTGKLIWEKRYGGSGQDKLTALLASSDNNYVLAGSSFSGKSGDKSQASQGLQDYWLVKVNGTGAKLWDKRFGGNGTELAWDLTETADKGYLVGGSSDSGISGDKSQSSQGKTDFWLVKTDAAGTRQWDRRYGGNQEDELRAMWPLAKGGYVLAGRSNSGKSGDKTTANLGNTDYWLVQVAPDIVPNGLIAARTETAAERSVDFRTYPNPFREKVTVQYRTAQTQAVNVLVYNSQGKVVARLFQGLVEAGQEQAWEWQPATHQASGLYIVRVHAPNQVLTSKLLLNR